MPTFYFMRHGECEANVAGTYAGWADSPLTATGIDSAKTEAKQLAEMGIHFTHIFSSPLSRALDTAQIIASAVSYDTRQVICIDELREKHNGTYEVLPIEELFTATEQQIASAGGESADQFAQRIREAIDAIRTKSELGENVLIVGHAGWYKMYYSIQQCKDIRNAHGLPTPPNNKLISITF
jgi:broad specificity phosphatase PhoE